MIPTYMSGSSELFLLFLLLAAIYRFFSQGKTISLELGGEDE